MAWFSPIKGSYPSLSQIDKTLPVASSDANKAIARGSIVKMTSDGEFTLAGAGDKVNVYVSLQNYTDAQASMAGGVNYGAGTVPGAAAVSRQPRITGLSLASEGEYQTDVFDADATYAVGDYLKVAAGGLLTKASDATNAVAVVTVPPARRWVNDAPATRFNGTSYEVLNSNTQRTGALVSVLQFATI